jgi:hypothetical protein
VLRCLLFAPTAAPSPSPIEPAVRRLSSCVRLGSSSAPAWTLGTASLSPTGHAGRRRFSPVRRRSCGGDAWVSPKFERPWAVARVWVVGKCRSRQRWLCLACHVPPLIPLRFAESSRFLLMIGFTARSVYQPDASSRKSSTAASVPRWDKARRNKNSKFIPESLLQVWGFEADQFL